jgi:hypothetical protein
MRKMICLVLATACLSMSAMEVSAYAARALPPGQESTEGIAKLKQKLLEVPSGTMVEVKLLNKQKIRGRLEKIDDQGFSLTTSQQGKIVTQTVAFTEVGSVKKAEGGKAGHAVVWMLAGVGVLVVIGVIIAVAQL